MSFRSIGDLAVGVLTKAERTANRRALKSRSELPDREKPDNSPGALAAPRLNSGAAGTSNAIGSAGPEGPASDGAHSVNGVPMPAGGAGKLKLVTSTGEPTHRPLSALPTRRVGSPVLVYERGHSTLANSP